MLNRARALTLDRQDAVVQACLSVLQGFVVDEVERMRRHSALGAWAGLFLSKQPLLLYLCFPLRFSEGFDAVGGVFEFLARQQFGDGEDLEAGIAARKVF